MRRFLILLLSCIAWINANAQPNPAPKARHSFIVICHRGDHVTYPENTLAGYAEAIRNGADYVEIDLRTTKDSALVSMHDGTVNRMTNAKGAVKDMTLAEIEQIQVKSRDSLDKTVYRVPTFEEIIKLCKDKIYIYIDFKNASAAATYATLKKYGMEKQVLVYINGIQQFIDWRHVAPDMPLMFSMPNSAKDIEGMKTFISQVKPDILDGSWKEYTKEMVQYATDQHIPVWPDIQGKDEDKDWDAAIALGFKGLQTDHPAALIKCLEGKGLR
jgi:glycerophosphoryl diester phosphodiesterase